MSNFDFLRSEPEFSWIADIAVKAEQSRQSDPSLCVAVCHRAAESAVLWIYAADEELAVDEELAAPGTFSELLGAAKFMDLVGTELWLQLDFLDKLYVQKARQVLSCTGEEAALALHSLFCLCNFMKFCYGNSGCGEERSLDLRSVRDSEKFSQKPLPPLTEMWAEFKLTGAMRRIFTDRRRERRGKYSSNSRRLSGRVPQNVYVEINLRSAGWREGDGWFKDHPLGGTAPNSKKIILDHVLYGSDGRPLAFVEMVGREKNWEKARSQAQWYAGQLEGMFGRRPFYFLTDGFIIRMRGGAKAHERQIAGFYSKRDLEKEYNKELVRSPLVDFAVSGEIAGRYYQEEAAASACAAFEAGDRKVLLSLAPGSGKLRVAAALADVLLRHGWIRNVLFLSDRNLMLQEAKQTFAQLLPDLSATNLGEDKAHPDARCVFSTYQAMVRFLGNEREEGRGSLFTCGRFDLVICGEAGSGIYRTYLGVLGYFDALLVGLTSLPEEMIPSTAYQFFGRKNRGPNYSYGMEQAAADRYLAFAVPVDVELTCKGDTGTESAAAGAKVRSGSRDSGRESGAAAGSRGMEDWLSDTDSIREMLCLLMTFGIRVDEGSNLGKTIIFARDHRHAEQIAAIFRTEYPEYPQNYCQVFDSSVRHVSERINEFSSRGRLPRIAVSVNLLDAGVNIPECVNLVFFRKVRSGSRFWQMFSQGTRLCPGLIDGRDKEKFYIFDFCGNCESFGIMKRERVPAAVSIQGQVFYSKAQLCYLLQGRGEAQRVHRELRLRLASELCGQIRALNRGNFAVERRIKLVEHFSAPERYEELSHEDILLLRDEIAPLLPPQSDGPGALRFDLLVYSAESALLAGGCPEREKKEIFRRAEVLASFAGIPEIEEKRALLEGLLREGYMEKAGLLEWEVIRSELRTLMKYLYFAGKHTERRLFCYQANLELFAFSREIQKRQYARALRILQGFSAASWHVRDILLKEFQFLFDPLASSAGQAPREERRLDLYCALWCLTAKRSQCRIEEPVQEEYGGDDPEQEDTRAEDGTEQAVAGEDTSFAGRERDGTFGSPAGQGRFLENAVLRLLSKLFTWDAELNPDLEERTQMIFDYLRRQNSGIQEGYDIRLVYRDEAGGKRICLLECKYILSRSITLGMILEKIVQVQLTEKGEIEHWILVAPCAKLDLYAAKFFEEQREQPGKYLPIKDIQVWGDENRVDELFGLIPELCDAIYGEDRGGSRAGSGENGGVDSEAGRRWILASWKDRLKPVILLPGALRAYPDQPEKLLHDLQNDRDLRERFDRLYHTYLKLSYLNEGGRQSEICLEDKISDWLYGEKDAVKVVLGEFGDGKTFFLYCLGRKLLGEFRRAPEEKYLPICFSLKRLGERQSPEALIESRMKELGCEYADFLMLKEKFHVLVCLDGLDEMSYDMDSGSMVRNARLLAECCRYFKGAKILITSRKQCFLSNRIRESLRERLGEFETLQIAPLSVAKAGQSLKAASRGEREREEVDRLMHSEKLLALASKPLFLGMFRDLLESEEPFGESEAAIYHIYILNCLRRKFYEFYDRENLLTNREETVERLFAALEELAFALQTEEKDSIAIGGIDACMGKLLPEILWMIKEPDAGTREDADNRFSMRTVLKYEGDDRVSFSHRSVKEYFVGRHLLRLLDEGIESGGSEGEREGMGIFLEAFEKGAYNYEIFLFFASCIQEEPDKLGRRTGALLSCLHAVKEEKRESGGSVPGRKGGAGLSLAAKVMETLYHLDRRIPDGEWACQDLSGIYVPGADFSRLNLNHSIFRNANLNNVRLDYCDCSYCDMTGARIEETCRIEALRPLGGKLRAVYRDGCVRDWDVRRGEAELLRKEELKAGMVLFMESGELFRQGREDAEILVPGKAGDGEAMRYGIQKGRCVLDVSESWCLIRDEGEEKDTYSLVNRANLERRHSWQIVRGGFGKIAGDRLAVVCDGKAGWELWRTDTGKMAACPPVCKEGGEIAAIDAAVVQDECRLVIGYDDGDVILARWSLAADGMGREGELPRGGVVGKALRISEHGLRHAVFLDENTLAADDADGTIRVLPVRWEKAEIAGEGWKTFQLGIYCRGIQVDGLTPEHVRTLLEAHR